MGLRISSSETQRSVVRWKPTNVSKKSADSIFRLKEYSKQESSMKMIARELWQVNDLFISDEMFGEFLRFWLGTKYLISALQL
jgi:hypothetical protein